MKLTLFLMTCLFFSLCQPVTAQQSLASGSTAPVTITADRLDADDAAQKLVFDGNAVARQGDVSISSDRLIVEYAPESREVQQIVAEGHVHIVQGARVATSGRAVYDKGTERIVLTDSPIVKEGPNSVQGHEIVLFMDGQRSIVKGGRDSRVKAIFQPGSGDAL